MFSYLYILLVNIKFILICAIQNGWKLPQFFNFYGNVRKCYDEHSASIPSHSMYSLMLSLLTPSLEHTLQHSLSLWDPASFGNSIMTWSIKVAGASLKLIISFYPMLYFSKWVMGCRKSYRETLVLFALLYRTLALRIIHWIRWMSSFWNSV